MIGTKNQILHNNGEYIPPVKGKLTKILDEKNRDL